MQKDPALVSFGNIQIMKSDFFLVLLENLPAVSKQFLYISEKMGGLNM